MVFIRRLNHGSSGNKIPVMPDVTKSARGKHSTRKRVESEQMCAFDLLATVAGNLLSGENSAHDTGTLNPSTTIGASKQVQQLDGEKLLGNNNFDCPSNVDSIQGSDVIFGQQTANKLKDGSLVFITTTSAPNSGFVKSEEHCAVVSPEPLAIGNKIDFGSYITGGTEKWHVICNSSDYVESAEFKGEGNDTQQDEHQFVLKVLDDNVAKMDISEDSMNLDPQPPLASLDTIAKVPLCTDNSHPSSFLRDGEGMELSADKDDDENSSGCTVCSIPNNKTSRQQQIIEQRLRKPLALKYKKAASRVMKDDRFCHNDVISKFALRNRRLSYTQQRKQRSSFKRMKLIKRCSGNISSSSTSGKQSNNDSSDYLVKLRIKSFMVPELCIDIPETASVGSLKQTVLEAVTALLQGEVHVGVLLRGKKVRDDNKTLRQAGISQEDEMDSLGFTLEPNLSKTPPLVRREDGDSLCITDDAEPLARMSPVAPVTIDQAASDSTTQPALTFCQESDHDSIHSPNASSLLNKSEFDSQALVSIPPMEAESQSVVSLQKSRRSEISNRRIRRPFTVTEVEALVQAVEKLGTGRWRDVKLRAFDNAEHRTYVDLKDKWKTLVHTAKISPQQRRGEPVPQELLNRVLSAHAFWSNDQAKLDIESSPYQLGSIPALL